MIKIRYTKVTQFLRLIVFLMIMMPLSLWAQNITISGSVTDNKNEPVVGATAAIKNTSVGTITDFDGNYSIDAPQNATLVIRFLGFIPQEEIVIGRSTINVVLKVDAQRLDEVVVVGYGTQRKV